MELWLFFTIFGAVIFVPSALLFLLLNRFRNTINVIFKINGALKRIVITDKILEKGEVNYIDGKKTYPIPISKDEIHYGKWRRWIVKSDLHGKFPTDITLKEIDEYVNNEDLLKLYLAGKFKDTLILLLVIVIGAVIIGGVINGYLTATKQCLSGGNETFQLILNSCKMAIKEVVYGNAT